MYNGNRRIAITACDPLSVSNTWEQDVHSLALPIIRRQAGNANMKPTSIRPTFTIDLSHLDVDPIRQIQNAVAAYTEVEGQFRAGHAMISMRPQARHFWSPWLHLDIRKVDGKSVLFGRFSPHPAIWTGYVFAYGTLTVLSVFSLIFGLSQYLSKTWPSAVLAFPICFAIAILLWVTAQIGQRLAHDEMHLLQELVYGEVASRKGDPNTNPHGTSH